jgi:hypothetical protein
MTLWLQEALAAVSMLMFVASAFALAIAGQALLAV